MTTRLIDAELRLASGAGKSLSVWRRLTDTVGMIAASMSDAIAAQRVYQRELASSLSHEKAAARTFATIYDTRSKH